MQVLIKVTTTDKTFEILHCTKSINKVADIKRIKIKSFDNRET